MSEIFRVGDRVLYISKDCRVIVCGVVEGVDVDGNVIRVEGGERSLTVLAHELTKLNMPDGSQKVDYVADILARKIRERMLETPYKFTGALSPEDDPRFRGKGQMNKPQEGVNANAKVTDFVDAVCNIFDELKETFRRKNEQYATADPLANFRTGALLNAGIDTWGAMYEEAKNYQRKHIAHVQNNKINGSKVDESLIDIAVYSVLMKYMRDRHYDEAIEDWEAEEPEDV